MSSAGAASELRSRIRSFITGFVPKADLGAEEDIFQTGFVNSMFALELVQFAERELGVTVENNDLELDNFRSIEALARFAERKRGG